MCKYIRNSEDTENYSDANCTYWIRDTGREFLTDPDGDIVNLARLTAYAEYGEQIFDAHIHHELPQLKIDAPAFLSPLKPEEHGQLHRQDHSLTEVGGIPLLREQNESE